MPAKQEIPKLEQDTVRFLKETIETFCKQRCLTVYWVAADEEGIRQLTITRERCNLEYPSAGYRGHFFSGFSGETLIKSGHLFLELRADHGRKVICDAVQDLTALQSLLELGGYEDILRLQIETGFLLALSAEERALERFKRKPIE